MSNLTQLHQEWDNPIGTKGFAFLAFAAPDAELMAKQLISLGFAPTARHHELNITLFTQGDMRFFLNDEPEGFAAEFAKAHGACAYAMGFQVEDADAGQQKLLAAGAKPAPSGPDVDCFGLPAISGIGGSLLYLADSDWYWQQFNALSAAELAAYGVTDVDDIGCGLTYLDHVTHNVYQGNMDQWAGFYEDLFNFREIRYFDIEGKLTGLKSRAMTSPCGMIRIPINESSDDKSQIAEYLEEYHGEGIQHIALGTTDIYTTVEGLRDHGVDFMSVPDTYYEKVDQRVPGHNEPLAELAKHRILIDGAPTDEQGLLLQIFTENFFGPIFFEIIQRKGNEGFGEGNFQALFESIELDQIRRGVLSEKE